MAHISNKGGSGWYEKPRFCKKLLLLLTPICRGCAAHSTTISKSQVIWRTSRCKILRWRGVIVPTYAVPQGVQVLQLTHCLFPRDQISLNCVLCCSQFCQGLCRFSGLLFFFFFRVVEEFPHGFLLPWCSLKGKQCGFSTKICSCFTGLFPKWATRWFLSGGRCQDSQAALLHLPEHSWQKPTQIHEHSQPDGLICQNNKRLCQCMTPP